MKRNVILPLVTAFVLLACSSAQCLGDGPGPEPICYPGTPCAAKLFDGGDPVPICYPGTPCAAKLFDGPFPVPICFPGSPCTMAQSDGPGSYLLSRQTLR